MYQEGWARYNVNDDTYNPGIAVDNDGGVGDEIMRCLLIPFDPRLSSRRALISALWPSYFIAIAPTPGQDEDGVSGDYDDSDNGDSDADTHILDHNDDHSHDNETRVKEGRPG